MSQVTSIHLLVLEVLELGRMDLEDADALAVGEHADDAIAGHRAAFLEHDGHVVLEAADGQHLRLLGLAAPPLPGQRNFRPMTLATLNQPSSPWPRSRRLGLRGRGLLGELGVRHDGADHVVTGSSPRPTPACTSSIDFCDRRARPFLSFSSE